MCLTTMHSLTGTQPEIGEMPFCLDKHGIRYSTYVTKAELYDLLGRMFLLLLVSTEKIFT